jgi:hypothetical protein
MKSTLSITAVIFTFGFVSLPIAFSDSDYRKHQSTGVIAVNNPLYMEECGSCHMAYSPGLLPSNGWTKLMLGLEDHFGDNAELDAETQQTVTGYLSANSASQSDYRRSRKLNQSINPNDVPIRISKIPYFINKHNEIPDRMVSGNPKVNSLSHCNSCHTKAEQGSFSEREIDIPDYGEWND